MKGDEYCPHGWKQHGDYCYKALLPNDGEAAEMNSSQLETQCRKYHVDSTPFKLEKDDLTNLYKFTSGKVIN